jgi:hypothetical protein
MKQSADSQTFEILGAMGQIQSIHSSPRRTSDDMHRFRAVGSALPGKASKLIYGPIIYSPLQQ